jgi:NADPH-dependent 2,4-dienoyl-CoA reductase/sulfur reductase-like enzyme
MGGTGGPVQAAARSAIIYGGRVNSPEVAEKILADGHADLVAVGRAHLADPAFVAKARGEDKRLFRPCTGTNDCINRGLAEGLPFACAVNPALGAGDRRALPPAGRKQRLLVVGGGPAGMQLAITARERGHDVELWEAEAVPGGQVLLAAMLPGQEPFTGLVDYQAARLKQLGVDALQPPGDSRRSPAGRGRSYRHRHRRHGAPTGHCGGRRPAHM